MTIHKFEDSEQACEVGSVTFNKAWAHADGVQFGDTLVVESEAVVAVATLYPFAVTKAQGEFHKFVWDEPFEEPSLLIALTGGIRAAVAEAKRLGLDLDPAYKAFASDAQDDHEQPGSAGSAARK